MKGRMSNELGSIVIDPNVIATYAGSVAVECFGIVGMAIVSMKDGLVRLLKRDSLERGLSVKIEDNKITIDFHVIVSSRSKHFRSSRQSVRKCKVPGRGIYRYGSGKDKYVRRRRAGD